MLVPSWRVLEKRAILLKKDNYSLRDMGSFPESFSKTATNGKEALSRTANEIYAKIQSGECRMSTELSGIELDP